MHEMALAERILRVVLGAAAGEKVRKVRLQVGRLRMIVPDGLDFSFQLLAGGTTAAEAALEMEETPATLRCAECGAGSDVDLPPFNCRRCGASDIEVISGDEVLVDAIELESGKTIRRRIVPVDELFRDHAREHAAQNGGNHEH